MVGPVSGFHEETQAEDIENFFSENNVPQGEITLKQTLEKLRVNVEFKKRVAKSFSDTIEKI